MADRLDYYFRQRVTEAELDLGFELLEKADRNLAADILPPRLSRTPTPEPASSSRPRTPPRWPNCSPPSAATPT